MISYIKILGPPHKEALNELEKIAVDMPQVCIMDRHFSPEIPSSLARDLGESRSVGYRSSTNVDSNWIGSYFNRMGVEITGERCESLISNSGAKLGEYDFFFEWYEKNPTSGEIMELIEKIDEALAPLGCLYSITTKKK